MGQQLKPFRDGTRQRIRNVGTVPYAAASALNPLELPHIGMASRVIVQFRGAVTLSGAGALTDQGPWNLAKRFRLNVNLGSGLIVDLSGYGAYVVQQHAEEMGYMPDAAGVGSAAPHADIHAAPVAGGANNWVLTWIIPISANTGAQFDFGMLNLQSPQVRAALEITTGAATDAAALITGIVGNFNVYYEYFEIPDPTEYQLPRLALARWLEEAQAVGATGDNTYLVPPGGVLTNLIHILSINNARSEAVDSVRVVFNKADTPYFIDRQALRVLHRLRYGINPQSGVYDHDFWHSTSDVSAGDLRDAIDTEELATLESIVTVTAGTGLGAAGTNTLTTIRRIFQTLD